VTEAQQQLRELLRDAGAESAALRVETGDLRSGVLRAVEEDAGELLVLGAHHRHRLIDLIGDPVDRLLHRAPCDLLVLQTEPGSADRYRHVMAATDLGESGRETASLAADVARRSGADLSLVHVVEHFPVDRENDDITPEDQDPATYRQERARQALTELAREIGHQGATPVVQVTTGNVGSAVAEAVAKRDVDLAVTGAHAHSDLAALLGSTSDTLRHRVQCDVLVVRIHGGGGGQSEG
jgi:universal stress protein A